MMFLEETNWREINIILSQSQFKLRMGRIEWGMKNKTSLYGVIGQRSKCGHEWLCRSQEKASVKC